ncbi:hypothetical protein HYR69_08865, partial [Candidatus Sumerlaeota bacterium]|nr:hypothetical protein [Candidatus Sumerlaeota bacterium]
MRVFILPLFLPIVIFTLCHQPNCQAATFNVSNVSQLISAINSANSNGQSNDVINMTTGTYTLTAVDNSGENGLPIISTSITINGNGSTLTRSAAAPVFRIFYISFFGVAELHNLIISGGKTAATFSDPSGGAIFNNGSLSIFDSTLSGNIATLSTSLGLNQYPGGGAIINFGDLSIYRSTLSGNTVTGGAISGLGGAVCSVPGSSGTLLEDSIFSGNSVSAPGTNGLGYGGAIFGQSTSIVRCTISGNSVSAGNLATGGGALVTAGSVWESTIWNNTVTGGTSPG